MFSGEGTTRSSDTHDDDATYLFLPQDITFAADGTAYYPDFNNHRIRQVSPDGIVTTVSGTGFLGDGPNDSGSVVDCWDGCPAAEFAWNHPTNVALDPADPTRLYVAAWHNSRLNVIDMAADTASWFAGTGGRFYGGGLDPATAMLPPDEREYDLWRAVLDLPSSIAFGADGTLYFSDQANHLIRKIAPGSDRVEVVAGTVIVDIDPATGLPVGLSPASTHRRPGFGGDGGDALLAKLHGHTDGKADPGSRLTYDEANNRLIIADTQNGVIRAYDIDSGVIDTIIGKYESAGTSEINDAISGETYTADAGSIPGYSGDGGDPLEAKFNTPRDVAIGIDGEIYVADTKNHCVRVVRDGIVDTFAGICDPNPSAGGYAGDGGPAAEASFTDVFGIGVDAVGDVYIADAGNHVIRVVRPVR